jgi:hypothetical protein
LEQEYAVAPVLPKMRVPLTDETTTIAPPCRFKCGTAYLTVRNVPVRLTARVLSHSCGSRSSSEAQTPLNPAFAIT